MKKIILLAIILFFSCSKKHDVILGTWKVNSKFYKATYLIEKQDKRLIGKVIYYNDDTTILHKTGTKKDIFLTNLKYKNDMYVDAISGATQTNSGNLTIKAKHKDTLEVTSYIKHKALIENWVRVK